MEWKPAQIAAIWIAAGGDRRTNTLINCVSVALAESGGNDRAISPSSDYGLWQINSIHFGDGIINSGNWWSPYTNAREAIRLSGNGSNWAAWCTAWVDPASNCGHGYLPNPQVGSPAYDQEQVAIPALNAAHLAGGTGQAPVLTVSPPAGVESTWADIQYYMAHKAPGQWGSIQYVIQALRRLAK